MQVKVGIHKPYIAVNKQQIIRFSVLFLISFLISRVAIAGHMMPFGAALCAAAFLHRKKVNYFAVFMGNILSCLVLWQSTSLAHIVLFCILFGLCGVMQAVRLKGNRITVLIALLLSYGVVTVLFSGSAPFDSLVWLMEMGISVVMVFVFSNTLKLNIGQKHRSVLMDDEIISITFVCLVFVLGLSDVSFFGVYLRNVAAILIGLVFAFAGGLAVGAAVGVMMGFGVVLAGGDAAYMSTIAMGALVAGLLNKTNRLACGAGMIAINVIMLFYTGNAAGTTVPIVDALMAFGFFLILPKKALDFVGSIVDANVSRMHTHKMNMQRFRELTVGRLKDISNLFSNVSGIFSKPEPKTKDFSQAVRTVRDNVCRDCTIANYCWQNERTAAEEFRRAYLEYQKNGYCELSKPFAKRCMKENTVNRTLNEVFQLFYLHDKVARQVSAAKKVVGEQLMGVSKVISSLGREFEADIQFISDYERTIQNRLEAAGFRTSDVCVEGTGENVFASVKVRSCGGSGVCNTRIKHIVGAVLGRKMELEKQLCQMGSEYCELKYLPKKKFSVEAHAISIQKHGNRVCGDAYATMELKDGRFMLLLCDGMGSGERAAEQSGAAVTLARNFYNAGFGDSTVIGSINKLLMLSSPDDTYSTMDLCMIDRNIGEAVFTKIGAPKSYIWRRGGVIPVHASALPIGILDEVKPSVRAIDLMDGDMIVLFSDGISDLAVNLDEYVKNCIAYESPENATAEMIRLALEMSGGCAHDDMTVIVARVKLVP